MHLFQVVDECSDPPACNPNEVSHGYVTIRVKPHHHGYEKKFRDMTCIPAMLTMQYFVCVCARARMV